MVLSTLLALAGASAFRFCGQDVFPDANYPPPNWESIRGMEAEYKLYPTLNEDGTWTYPYREVPFLKDEKGALRPFLFNLRPRFPLCPRPVLFGKFRRDLKDYRQWAAEHPEFRGFITLEWVNDARIEDRSRLVNYRFLKKPEPGKPDFSLTPEQVDEFFSGEEFAHGLDDRHQFSTNYLRKAYDRIVNVCFDDPGRLWLGDGIFCCDHLAADWGAGGLAFETTRNYAFWQIQMMFVRGAAAQYDIPFHWFVASFFDGYNFDGSIPKASCTQRADTPQEGISVSAIKRVSYLSWFCGADAWERECMKKAICHRKVCGAPPEMDGVMSAEGRVYDDFYHFVKANDRGESYRTVALVVPLHRGYSRNGGQSFLRFDYTRGDFRLDAVMSVILDFPQNRRLDNMKRGIERIMANSRYGDVFDVLCPDVTRRDSFRRSLKSYKVAIVPDESCLDDESRKVLDEFVRGGGQLILGEDAWTPWFGDDANGQKKALGMTALGGSLSRFPEIEKAISRSVLLTHPFKVDGDVQFGFNRLKDGWIVYLINNGGVVKFGDRVEMFDGKGADVTISIGERTPRAVREMLTGRILTHEGGRVCLNVPSGDVRAVFIEGEVQ